MNKANTDLDSNITENLGIHQSATWGKWSKRILLGVGLILLLGVVSAVWLSRDSTKTVQYRTEPVQRGNLTVTVTATGTLEPTNQVDVGSELSGIIKSVDVDYNDAVTVGEVLAKLDTSKLDAQVLQSKAALQSAEAKVLEAKATVLETKLKYDRCEKLVARQLCSKEDADSLRAAYTRAQAQGASAKATVSQAEAALNAIQTDLSKTVIRSPINGIVLKRSVEPGQTVAASLQAPVLFTLAEDLRKMQLHVNVDEADVGKVKDGQAATFNVDAYPDRDFPARITQVRYGSETVQGVVTYETLLDVDNSDLSLRPGMTATADITVQNIQDANLVPNAALRFTPPVRQQAAPSSGGSILSRLFPRRPRSTPKQREASAARGRQQRVWILRDNKPVAIPVTTGATNGIVTQVLGGDVKPGMELVVDTTSTGR
jgi:HlyD family secretion protein